jgi:TonB-linked SusC/RagA family outer membrane protein
MKISADLVEALTCPQTARDRQKRRYRTRLIMRVGYIYSILIVMSGLLIHAHAGYGQILEQRVNVGMNDESLDVLFKRLEKQTSGISWLYGSIKQPKVSFPAADRSLKETLELGLQNSGYTYEVKNNDGILILRTNRSTDDPHDKRTEIDSRSLLTVTGTIIDSVTQQPMPGVNVVVRGTSRGTSSDQDGNYILAVEPSETLIFTFIGYKPLEIQIGNRTRIDVVLEQDVAMLGEVTVSTNYYETSDRLKTGSIVKITAKEIENQPVTSPLMALQGRVPGLQITPFSGAPGSAPTIRIRGTNSLRNDAASDTNGNYPLYVVDGIPVNSMQVSNFTTGIQASGYDPLSTINPSEIENIQVLKDGDATAIYGSRGANGVILITTKRNRKQQERTSISVSGYKGIGEVAKRLDLLNTQQYISMRKEALRNDNLTPGPNDYDLIYWDTTRYTDWQKLFLSGQANITDVQTNVSSGSKNTSFRFSSGYHKETLIFGRQFGYSRFNGQLSVNHVSNNNKFRISVSSTLGVENSRLFADGNQIMSAAISLAPNSPNPFNSDGSLNWEVHNVSGVQRSTWKNPFSYYQKKQTANTLNSISSANLSYNILPSLYFSTNIGYTNLINSGNAQTPRSSLAPETAANSLAAFADFTGSKRTSLIIEPKLDFSTKIADHQVDAVIGTTWQTASNSYTVIQAAKYASDALLGSLRGAGQLSVVSDDLSKYRYNSLYARIGYNWRQKYLVNLTGRRDGSSRFGPGNKFGNFGAIGAGWIFSEEKALKSIAPILYFGKLRASYGITGSDQIGDYRYYSLYNLSASTYDGTVGYIPNGLLNPNYAWEVTRKLEVALELAFFDNRIGAEISMYRNRSSNQLIDYPLSSITGFSSLLTNFGATVQNSGLEAVIHSDVLNSDDWKWNVSLNVTLPRNQLLRFDGIENSPYANVYKVGAPLSARNLYTSTGVNPETGTYGFIDYNNDGNIDDLDKKVISPKYQVWYGGVTSTIRYKSFELSLLFQISRQQNSPFMPGLPGSKGFNQSTTVLGRWRESGDHSSIQKFSTTSENNANFIYENLSNSYLIDASFLRLKTTSLIYRLPQEWCSMAHVSNADIFLQGQNLFTITNYTGLDAETGNSLPPLRMVTLGAHLNF